MNILPCRQDGSITATFFRGAIERLRGPFSATMREKRELPLPGIYVMPSTIASPRNNPRPVAQELGAEKVVARASVAQAKLCGSPN